MGGRNNKGYGKHRELWILLNGPLPPKTMVLHSCDNPPCMNPAHLFAGTNSVNVRDMVAKGRQVIPNRDGELHPRVKLTEKQVRAIRKMLASGRFTQQELADMHGVKQAAISKIVLRRTWDHIL